MEEDEERVTINTSSPKSELASCVVWTQIPLLSWLFPFIGHVGICDSNGVVYDFQGPYHVGKGKLLFGDPLEKWEVGIDSETLDRSIKEASEEFKNRIFSILCSNCHFYVATVLKNANYKQRTCCCSLFNNWTTCATIKIAFSLLIHGRSIKCSSKMCVYAGALITWGIIIVIILMVKGVF
jgi:hypothetical protein